MNCFYVLSIAYTCVFDDLWSYVQHALPDPGKVSKVKHIVEFCRGREHLHFDHLPQAAGQGHQLHHSIPHILGEASLGTVVAYPNHTWKGEDHHIPTNHTTQSRSTIQTLHKCTGVCLQVAKQYRQRHQLMVYWFFFFKYLKTGHRFK